MQGERETDRNELVLLTNTQNEEMVQIFTLIVIVHSDIF